MRLFAALVSLVVATSVAATRYGTVATGLFPHVITGDASGRLYVSNVSGKSVTVVDPTGAQGERFVALHRDNP